MANRDILRSLWRLYTDFKLWASASDATSKRFKVEDDSFENKSLLENNAAAASTTDENIVAIIIGLIYPSSEPFKRHALRIKICLPSTFPDDPPIVYMLTKIRHPNIDKNGRICAGGLDKTKKYRATTLAEIVKLITALIDQPEPSSPVDAETANLFDLDKAKYIQELTETVRTNGIPIN